MNTYLFETERLLCRRWTADDLPSVYAVYADPVGARWVGDGKPITYVDARRWMDVTQANYARRGYGMLALVCKGSTQLVGFGGLVHPNGQAEAEIKYAFARRHWGQGYASEAVAGLLTYGHEVHGLDRIIATVAPENAASQRVLVKSGFVRVDTQVEAQECSWVFEWRA